MNSKINNLQATIEIFKEEKVTSEENSNDEKIDATTKTENVNKRLYKLYNNQRYILLMDDNKYDLEENFLNKKTYILDLNMKDSSEIVKEIDLSSKLKPFVDNYINENKGTTKREYTIEYFDVEDLLTPLDIDTLFYETACGSGSVAVCLVESYLKKQGQKIDIIQPSGLTITANVDYKENNFERAIISGNIEKDGKTYELDL